MKAPVPQNEAERLATETLRISEEFKTRMIESSQDCIKVLDLEGRLLFMNAGGMARLEVCDLGPFLNTSWIDFWQGEDREKARAAVAAARDGRVGRFVGYFPTTVSRKPMWWDVVVSAILNAEGRPERLLAISRDVTEPKHVEEVLRAIMDATASVTGVDFFYSLVRHLASILHVRYAFLAECRDKTRPRARTLAFWKGSGFGDNVEYDVAPTPCAKVLAGQVAHYSEGIQQLFPEDRDLSELGAESYLGVPVLDASGQVIGHLAVLDVGPMDEDPRIISVLKIFAARAGAELERLRAEGEIKSLNTKLRKAADRSRTLLEINNALISNLTQDALFQAIARSLRRVVPFDRTAIFLHDPQKDVLRLWGIESSLPSSYFVGGLEMPTDDSHVGWVFKSQTYRLRRDLEREREYPMERRAYGDGVRSYVMVPLVARGRTIGVWAAASARKDQYSESDAAFLQEVANQVALAVENMKDYEEIARLKAMLERENVYLQEEIRQEHHFEEMVGSSPALLALLGKVEQVAPTDSTVLIYGETGTGKELIARAIHGRSVRKERPLVKVNCSAISAGLVESELFGHVKGAFTGAIERRIGRFELADGGTIFLDEIGELPMETQAKLLRVLQEQEFEPVGSSKPVRVNVRVIAATNRELQEAMRTGRFRSDLFYRLNVVPIVVPPLRDRRSDIPELAMFFLSRFSRRFDKRVSTISQETMDRLRSYPWPGNIRELQNVIERAVVLSHGPVLELDPDLLPISQAGDRLAAGAVSRPSEDPRPSRLPTMEEMERSHILVALRQAGGVIEGRKGAANLLNIHPNTLRSRMKTLGIRRSGHEIS